MNNEERNIKCSLFNVTWLSSLLRVVEYSDDGEWRMECNFEGRGRRQ